MVAIAMNDLNKEYSDFLLEANTKNICMISLLLNQLVEGKCHEEAFNEIFKLNHIIKNNCKLISMYKLAYASHRFEDLVLKLKNKQIVYTPMIHEACWEFCNRMSDAIEILKIDLDYEMDIAIDLKNHFKEAISPQLIRPKSATLPIVQAGCWPIKK